TVGATVIGVQLPFGKPLVSKLSELGSLPGGFCARITLLPAGTVKEPQRLTPCHLGSRNDRRPKHYRSGYRSNWYCRVGLRPRRSSVAACHMDLSRILDYPGRWCWAILTREQGTPRGSGCFDACLLHMRRIPTGH